MVFFLFGGFFAARGARGVFWRVCVFWGVVAFELQFGVARDASAAGDMGDRGGLKRAPIIIVATRHPPRSGEERRTRRLGQKKTHSSWLLVGRLRPPPALPRSAAAAAVAMVVMVLCSLLALNQKRERDEPSAAAAAERAAGRPPRERTDTDRERRARFTRTRARLGLRFFRRGSLVPAPRVL